MQEKRRLLSRPRATCRRALVLGVSLFAVASLSLIAAAAEGPPSGSIGPGDLLRISVLGDENVTRVLSGDFRVEEDGSIAYPVVGKLHVAGVEPSDVADSIRIQLGDQVPIGGLPTVSVAEYANVFLLGSVRATGPHEYRPGMTVFQLVVAAGGVAPPAMPDTADAVTGAHEITDLTLLRYSLELEKARLLAEIHRQEFPSQSVPQPVEGGESLLEVQSAIMLANEATFTSKMQSLKAKAETYGQEISSLRQTMALHEDEVKLMEEQVQSLQQLVDKNLAPTSRLVDLKRQLSVVRRESLEFQTALFGAEQGRIEATQGLSDVELEARLGSLRRLAEVELQVQRTNLNLEVARAKAGMVVDDAGSDEDSLGLAVGYRLIRREGGKYASIEADETTSLRRGDIVDVHFRIAPRTSPSAPRLEVGTAGENLVQ